MHKLRKSAVIAHFDASGTDDQSPLLTVACYAAAEARWRPFDREWRRFLKLENLEYFRMVEQAHGTRQFSEASDEKRLRCLKKTHAIIKSHTEKGLAATVDKKAFDEVIGEKNFGTSLGFGVFSCLVGVLKSMPVARQVTCVLDRGDRRGPELEELQGLFKKHVALSFAEGEWRFADKREAPGIQAADTLAYEVTKFWREPDRPPRISLQKLYREGTDENKLWDATALRAWRAGNERAVRLAQAR